MVFLVTSLAPFIALANIVAADPIAVRDSLVSLPLARRINASGAGRNLVQGGRERARSLSKQTNPLTSEVSASVGVTNTGIGYTASVGIGTPPTYYNLQIDTGSSNTWIGAGEKYVRTNTSVQTSDLVFQVYGTGAFFGNEYTDTVTIASNLVIPQQSIGVALVASDFHGVDGIFGINDNDPLSCSIGPADLTIGSLVPDINASIPTVTDNLFMSGVIPYNLVSVSFEPTTANLAKNASGELTFGGTDPNKFIEPITYIPLTTASPANKLWGVDLSIQYGDSALILQKSPCTIDTGTTLILIPTESFGRYQNATGAVLDEETGLLSITQAQFNDLKSLFFTIGGKKFEFTANAQIWPRTLNWSIGGKPDSIYLIVSDIGVIGESGVECINGYSFLERYYSVFDTTNRRIGFASTQFTMADSN